MATRTIKPPLHDDTADNLRDWWPEGSTVHVTLRHVSASGMRRVIGVVAIDVERAWRGIVPTDDGEGRHEWFPSRAAARRAGDYSARPVNRIFTRGAAGWPVAALLGYRYDRRREGVIMDGAGMDMGFALVYELAQRLYGDGYALGHQWI